MSKKIDFIYNSKIEYSILKPLYNFFINKGEKKCRLAKIHTSRLLNRIKLNKISNYVILSSSSSYNRLKRYGWNGKLIYVDHGISPVKYFSYIYDFFFEANLLFYPGNIFKKKMEKILDNNYKNGLLGGYTIIDDLLNTRIDKPTLIDKYNLKHNKPIILFAPTWGSKKNKTWGLHNLKFFAQIDNLITIPHPSDYSISKIFSKITIPKNRQELNNILHLSDIVISDISSIILEASIINKNTIQLILDHYPGTFPNIDINKKNIVVSKNILENEINKADIKKKPFKISFLDQEMIVDFISTPNDIQKTINEILINPNKNINTRKYWINQCCWKFDGKTNERIYKMILNYINNNEIKQLS